MVPLQCQPNEWFLGLDGSQVLSQLLVKFPRFTCNVTQYKCGVQRRVIKRLSIEVVRNGYINRRRELDVKVCRLSGKGSFVAHWVLGSTPALVSFFCKEISPLFIFLIFLMLIRGQHIIEACGTVRHSPVLYSKRGSRYKRGGRPGHREMVTLG